LLGVLAGCASLVGSVWLYYSRIELKPLVIPLQALTTAAGSGAWSEGGIEVAGTDDQGRATFVAPVTPFSAELYDSFSWEISGFSDASGGAVLWVSDRGRVGQVFVRRLTLPDVRDGRISLRDHPDWQGHISQVGVVIQGPLAQPVRIEGLKIEPRSVPLSIEESLPLAARNWFKSDPWNGGSVHFLGVTGVGERFTPSVWVAVAVGATVLVFLAISVGLAARAIGAVAVAFTLLGWFILDLRWQLQLTTNIEQGLEKPDSLSNTLADRKLSDLATKIPLGSVRVFVVSAEPDSYAPLRARYLLAPHRVHVGFRTIAEITTIKPGDHVLVVSTRQKLQFDQSSGQLIAADRRLGAELVSTDESFGSLFRITRVP
jgi:hypothetical protein